MCTIIDALPSSVPVQYSLFGPIEIPDVSTLEISEKVRWVVAKCICPTLCDCEDSENGLGSNSCPEHNLNPIPNPECPLCNLSVYRH